MMDKIFRRNPHTATRIIDAEAIVMTPEDGVLHSFNRVGTRIWELCDGKNSLKQIVNKVSDEFDGRPEMIRSDTRDFIRELISKDMLIFKSRKVRKVK
jgi:hypothetical protein